MTSALVPTQPFNRIVWPHEATADGSSSWGATAIGPWPWQMESAARIPGVARATAVYAETIKQCALDAYRGIDPLDRPRLLDRPDPDRTRSWFVRVQIEDYLWHGNALHLVTVRGVDGWPVAVQWIPAAQVRIATEPTGRVRYFDAQGNELPAGDLVHVRRGSDRNNPGRGVGVVEQHLSTLDRAALEEAYERNALAGSGVPSVAIVVPNAGASGEELDDAYDRWMEKFYGPTRSPVFLPAGTTIEPLGWSPEQSQMVEARKMTLQDIANIFNLDGYWLGAESSGLTYKSPGPLYVALLRTSLEGVLVDLEQTWGDAWLPRGQTLRFDRLALTRDDFASSITTLAEAVTAGLISVEEARTYIGLAATIQGAATIPSPVDTTGPGPAQEAPPVTASANGRNGAALYPIPTWGELEVVPDA